MIINVGESSAKATSYDDTSTSLGANNVQNAISIISNKVPFKFGIDGDGNYGYYKADDSFVPFKSTVTKVLLKTTSGSYGWSGGTNTAPSSFTIDIKNLLPTKYNLLTDDNFFGIGNYCWYSNSKHGDSYYRAASTSYNASTGILTCKEFHNAELINPNTSSQYYHYTILPTAFYMIY